MSLQLRLGFGRPFRALIEIDLFHRTFAFLLFDGHILVMVQSLWAFLWGTTTDMTRAFLPQTFLPRTIAHLRHHRLLLSQSLFFFVLCLVYFVLHDLDCKFVELVRFAEVDCDQVGIVIVTA